MANLVAVPAHLPPTSAMAALVCCSAAPLRLASRLQRAPGGPRGTLAARQRAPAGQAARSRPVLSVAAAADGGSGSSADGTSRPSPRTKPGRELRAREQAADIAACREHVSESCRVYYRWRGIRLPDELCGVQHTEQIALCLLRAGMRKTDVVNLLANNPLLARLDDPAQQLDPKITLVQTFLRGEAGLLVMAAASNVRDNLPRSAVWLHHARSASSGHRAHSKRAQAGQTLLQVCNTTGAGAVRACAQPLFGLCSHSAATQSLQTPYSSWRSLLRQQRQICRQQKPRSGT